VSSRTIRGVFTKGAVGYRRRMRSLSVSLPLVLSFLLMGCDAKQPVATKPDAQPAAKTPEEKPAEVEPKPAEVAELPPAPKPNAVTLDHQVKLLDGTEKSLTDYRGKTLLVVNVASACGFTPQYAELQQLYATYKDKGLEVLAFPSNDFGGQEPGSALDIRTFVDKEFSVEFTMFDKVVTKGESKAPIYKTLTEETGEGIKGEINWNFTKFLVDPQGRVIQRFEPPVGPLDPQIVAAIEHVLPGA
jgi:glutathione peroxidase